MRAEVNSRASSASWASPSCTRQQRNGKRRWITYANLTLRGQWDLGEDEGHGDAKVLSQLRRRPIQRVLLNETDRFSALLAREVVYARRAVR